MVPEAVFPKWRAKNRPKIFVLFSMSEGRERDIQFVVQADQDMGCSNRVQSGALRHAPFEGRGHFHAALDWPVLSTDHECGTVEDAQADSHEGLCRLGSRSSVTRTGARGRAASSCEPCLERKGRILMEVQFWAFSWVLHVLMLLQMIFVCQ